MTPFNLIFMRSVTGLQFDASHRNAVNLIQIIFIRNALNVMKVCVYVFINSVGTIQLDCRTQLAFDKLPAKAAFGEIRFTSKICLEMCESVGGSKRTSVALFIIRAKNLFLAIFSNIFGRYG